MEDEGSRKKWSLTLYIAGAKHPKSAAAYANLKRICEEHIPGSYKLTVVDVTLKPERAAIDQILAIPTLVRNSPLPVRRIIGDLYDTTRVLVSLDLYH